jgi:ferredoxin--NADP+ reductase
VKGEYVAGWIKRGPTGVIGTNKADAQETVMSLLEDDVRTVAKGASRRDAVEALLQERGVCFVQFKDWQKLNAFEMRCGEDQGRPRIKVTSVAEMLERCEVS